MHVMLYYIITDLSISLERAFEYLPLALVS